MIIEQIILNSRNVFCFTSAGCGHSLCAWAVFSLKLENMQKQLIHASCVAVNGLGVLLAGAPGSGKSALALQLIIDSGAELVSDDQTFVYLENGTLAAAAPESIFGLIEVRHVGLLCMSHRPSAPVELYVELVPDAAQLERLPEPAAVRLLGHAVRLLRLPAHESATPAKIKAALLYKKTDQICSRKRTHDG